MRPTPVLLLAFTSFTILPAAYADTVYDLVFAGSAGPVIGDGSLTLNVAPPSGTSTFDEAGDASNTGDTITGFSATIDGFVFNLADGTQLTTAMFDGSSLAALNYADLPIQPDFSGGPYLSTYPGNGFQIFNTLAPYPNDSGTFTATEVTPEPTSLALLGTGLLGGIGVTLRRLANPSLQKVPGSFQ